MNPHLKTAIVLSTLPDEQCVDILKHMKEDEVSLIAREMLSLSQVDAKTRQGVLVEFQEMLSGRASTLKEGAEYVESILARAFGIRRASLMMNHMEEHSTTQVDLDDLIAEIGSETVATDLQKEHPQVIASILSSLSTKKAADVLAFFTEEAQMQALSNIAVPRPMPSDLADKIKRGFTEKLILKKSSKRSIGKEGVRSSAEILVLLPPDKSKKILESLKSKDEELAKNVEAAMFSFDDIVKVDDKDLQKILASINQADLKLALRKSKDETKEKIYANMSERAATMLKEDIEMMGPQKKEAISAAQQRIVGVIRKLEESGQITISRGTGEEAALV